MKPKLLPIDIVSSLGRSLQVIYKDRFSESFLNRILRLMLDNPEVRNIASKAVKKSAVIQPYKVCLLDSVNENTVIKLQKILNNKNNLILLEIMPGEPSNSFRKVLTDPETLFKAICSLVYYITNGVKIISFGRLFSITENPEEEADIKETVNLLKQIIRVINPCVFVITDVSKFPGYQGIIENMK